MIHVKHEGWKENGNVSGIWVISIDIQERLQPVGIVLTHAFNVFPLSGKPMDGITRMIFLHVCKKSSHCLLHVFSVPKPLSSEWFVHLWEEIKVTTVHTWVAIATMPEGLQC